MESEELKKLIGKITGAEMQVAKFSEREGDRRNAVEKAMNSLKGQKEQISKDMHELQVTSDKKALKGVELDPTTGLPVKERKVSKRRKHEKAFSEDGQEYAIDTFRSTRKGRGLTAKDMKKAGAALKPIVDAAREMLAEKTSDGEPLFATREDAEKVLMHEFFTPLVREGILPDNFVLNDFSEVQLLLDNAFGAYKKTNEETRGERELENAKQKVHLTGADGTWSKVKARGNQLAKLPNKALDRIGIDETARRRIGIGLAAGGMVKDMFAMGKTLDSWTVEPGESMSKIEKNFAEQLNPKMELDGKKFVDPDDARAAATQEERKVKVHKYITQLGLSSKDEQRILDVLNVQETTGYAVSKESKDAFMENLEEIINGLALPGDQTRKLQQALNKANHDSKNINAAIKAAQEIDAKLVELLDTYLGSGVGSLVKGMYVGQIDIGAVSDAVGGLQPDDQALIGELAAALQGVFHTGLDPKLAQTGTDIAKAFIGKVDGRKLRKGLLEAPDGAFSQVVEAAVSAIEEKLKTAGPTDKTAALEGVLTVAFSSVGSAIDKAIVAAVKAAAGDDAAEAISGAFSGRFAPDRAAALVKLDPSIDAKAALAMIADGITTAFENIAPEAAEDLFKSIGGEAGKAFSNAANPSGFSTELATDLKAAFKGLLSRTETAIANAVEKHRSELTTALKSPTVIRELATKTAMPDGGDEAMKEMEASDKEIAEYERQLVLLDEGGAAAADLQSIERLIAQIERDRAIAEMVVAAGNALTSLGTSSTSIAGSLTVAVTDTLVGEIAGPLKAAKLIIKFAVAMKAANERRILLMKFKKSLELAKSAVSPMQSTVQGFFNNKVEQITFRTIEDALTLVQIAAAVVGSVPEPITMAIGKTISATATALESAAKVSEMAFNEAALSHAWKVTMMAIRNPSDRATGLKALRLNPTLGMHAIAWAGMERKPPDPIARNLLSELGLNEQTLQVSGTEAKVRKYLETVLNEDRVMIDPNLVAPDWVPKVIELSVESWSVTVNRAWRDAEPKLRRSTERSVLEQLKLIEKRDLNDARTRADQGQLTEEEAVKMLDEMDELLDRLDAYAPVTNDGSVHDEMLNLTATFIKLARDRRKDIQRIIDKNNAVQIGDATMLNGKLDKMADKIKLALVPSQPAPNPEVQLEKLSALFDEAVGLMRAAQYAYMDEHNDVKSHYQALQAAATQLNQEMTRLEGEEEEEEETTV